MIISKYIWNIVVDIVLYFEFFKNVMVCNFEVLEDNLVINEIIYLTAILSHLFLVNMEGGSEYAVEYK